MFTHESLKAALSDPKRAPIVLRSLNNHAACVEALGHAQKYLDVAPTSDFKKTVASYVNAALAIERE